MLENAINRIKNRDNAFEIFNLQSISGQTPLLSAIDSKAMKSD